MKKDELSRLEYSTYRAAADSGLWDMFLAAVISMLAIGPLLSPHLGDYWSSAVFLPVFAVAWLAIHLVQERVVKPRLGVVEFGARRKKRLVSLTVIMLVVNIAALVAGIFASTRPPTAQQDHVIIPLTLSLILLAAFSTASFFLQIPRVFAYGVLLAAAPPIGEALFQRGLASHHGFPVVFGISALTIFVAGIVRFVRFLPPPPARSGGPSRGRNP